MFDELTNNLKISLDGYFLNLKNNPFEILTVVLDFLCVAILIYMFFTLVKKSIVKRHCFFNCNNDY